MIFLSFCYLSYFNYFLRFLMQSFFLFNSVYKLIILVSKTLFYYSSYDFYTFRKLF